MSDLYPFYLDYLLSKQISRKKIKARYLIFFSLLEEKKYSRVGIFLLFNDVEEGIFTLTLSNLIFPGNLYNSRGAG